MREACLPQLQMLRPSLSDLPDMELPEGFEIKPWRRGMGEEWTRIISLSFNEPAERYKFDQVMRNDRAFAPQRVLFLKYEGELIATASAWHNPCHLPLRGIVHYVAVLPEWRGKQLGYWMTVAALQLMKTERRTEAFLLTDDHRLAAIKTYLRLGFVPVLEHSSTFPERWQTIFQALDQKR